MGVTSFRCTCVYFFLSPSRDNPVAAKLLIAAGADVNAKEYRGVTPIMMASALGHTDTLEVILASPVANVNIQVSVAGVIVKFLL